VKGDCSRCEQTQAELEAARLRIAELEQQLAEIVKLCELQACDLERYQKAFEARSFNHPERVARDVLQLAFSWVLDKLADTPAANDVADDAARSAEADVADEASAHSTPEHSSDSGKRRKRRHGRRNANDPALAALPVEPIYIDPPEVLAAGGEGYICIGEEIGERIAQRIAAYFRLRFIRRKWVPASSLRANQPGSPVLIAPLPESVWPRVMADASSVSQVIMDKYADLLPLNRQQGISERSGLPLHRSTLCDWLSVAAGYLQHIPKAMLAESRREAFCIATDGTSVSVRSKGSKCERWHLFTFIADRDHVVFDYDREETGAVFVRILDGFHGHLLADANSVYDVLYREHGITEAGCWYHCRRGFYRAMQTEREPALEALSLISRLFKINDECIKLELAPDELTRERARRARPVLALFDEWVKRTKPLAEPRGRLEAAIGYYENQRDALRRFLDDGRLRLDNNISEAQLRHAVVGEANWTFFANETGLRWYTIFRSLIASCALHGLNPQLYLEQVLRLAPHWPRNRVIELSPKYWSATVAGLSDRWRAIITPPWQMPPACLPDAVQLTRAEPDARSAA
jgi:transposase